MLHLGSALISPLGTQSERGDDEAHTGSCAKGSPVLEVGVGLGETIERNHNMMGREKAAPLQWLMMAIDDLFTCHDGQ